MDGRKWGTPPSAYATEWSLRWHEKSGGGFSEAGAQVTVAKADVTSEEQVANVLADISPKVATSSSAKFIISHGSP